MRVKSDALEFEWDEYNRDKIYQKHGISTDEIESIFLDPALIVLPDVHHSQKEPRYIAIGKDKNTRNMHCVFTMRGRKMRVISARRMHDKEVIRHEKTKKDTTL